MIPVKRNQTLPPMIDRDSIMEILVANNGSLMMLGYFFEGWFYTHDLGHDNWEAWDLSNETIEMIDSVKHIIEGG